MSGGELSGSAKQTAIAPLYVVAHDLKSPLALTRQLLLVAQRDGISDQERAMLLRRATLLTDRTLRLTSDLTRTATMTDSQLTVEPLNVWQLCEQVARDARPLYQEYGRQLAMSRRLARRASSLGLANRDYLWRVIMQLVDNALHYGAADTPVQISLSTKRGSDNLVIGVRDFGPAMPLTVWREICNSRAASPANRPGSSGLGLYIAHEFAANMGARLGVTRHRDGTTFYIELPLSRQLALL